MSSFTFLLIPDSEAFLQLVERSLGEVTLHLPDGSQCDLKRDRTARQMLRVLDPGRNGLRISLSNQMDANAFLRYMREAALCKRTA